MNENEGFTVIDQPIFEASLASSIEDIKKRPTSQYILGIIFLAFMSILILLGVIFFCLKLDDIVAWPWTIVFIPLFIILTIIAFFALLILSRIERGVQRARNGQLTEEEILTKDSSTFVNWGQYVFDGTVFTVSIFLILIQCLYIAAFLDGMLEWPLTAASSPTLIVLFFLCCYTGATFLRSTWSFFSSLCCGYSLEYYLTVEETFTFVYSPIVSLFYTVISFLTTAFIFGVYLKIENYYRVSWASWNEVFMPFHILLGIAFIHTIVLAIVAYCGGPSYYLCIFYSWNPTARAGKNEKEALLNEKGTSEKLTKYEIEAEKLSNKRKDAALYNLLVALPVIVCVSILSIMILTYINGTSFTSFLFLIPVILMIALPTILVTYLGPARQADHRHVL